MSASSVDKFPAAGALKQLRTAWSACSPSWFSWPHAWYTFVMTRSSSAGILARTAVLTTGTMQKKKKSFETMASKERLISFACWTHHSCGQRHFRLAPYAGMLRSTRLGLWESHFGSVNDAKQPQRWKSTLSYLSWYLIHTVMIASRTSST